MNKTGHDSLRELCEYGQSVWLDYMRRSFITSGELQHFIDEDGLCGITSNPSIFEKAIVESNEYQDILLAPGSRKLKAEALYEVIAVRDIQDAAAILRPVYDQTRGRDGYVSLEVSPLLAHDTQGTIAEAQRLWAAVGRDNLMVKVPATQEGIPAIAELIGVGVNVNITLLFSQAVYERVAEAYFTGLERRVGQGGDISRIASVASFFISRIDTAVDKLLTAALKATSNAQKQSVLRSLLGKVAIANAKQTYERYQALFRGARWQALASKGAQTQRLLWASTSAKNPQYRDVLYVEELIGPDTVNTLPPATFDAFRDHGRLRASLTEDLAGAADTMKNLAHMGISMQEVTASLLEDGVRQFAEAFAKVLKATTREEKISLSPQASA